MSTPVRQHFLPKAYLKNFVIDPEVGKQQSLVWLFRENNYSSIIEKVSIKGDRFRIRDFYTDPGNTADPYFLEKYFSNLIEPGYHRIIDEIRYKATLSIANRATLLQWLYCSKFRSLRFREYMMNPTGRLNNYLYYPKIVNSRPIKAEDRIDNEFVMSAKEIQIGLFDNTELQTEFITSLGSKEWFIWVSERGNFITSDDPGFSINLAEGDPRHLDGFFRGNVMATNFYPLSSHYCLQISPFNPGTPPEINMLNESQKITIEVAEENWVNYINKHTLFTRHNYLLGSKKEVLEALVSGIGLYKSKWRSVN